MVFKWQPNLFNEVKKLIYNTSYKIIEPKFKNIISMEEHHLYIYCKVIDKSSATIGIDKLSLTCQKRQKITVPDVKDVESKLKDARRKRVEDCAAQLN